MSFQLVGLEAAVMNSQVPRPGAQKFRNLRAKIVHYSLTAKGRSNLNNTSERKLDMKITTHNRFKALAAVAVALLACSGLSATARADSHSSIVGLWKVNYTSTTGGPSVITFDQWHSDGQEIETANLFTGAICQGTFKRMKDRTFQLYHVSWTFDSTGAYSGWWDENLTATVSENGHTYSGTYSRDFYDVNGTFLFEDDGTLTATRLTPND